MTREEAIKHIKDILCENNTVKHSDMVVFETEKEALRMAIEALEPQPCDDCISRQAALDLPKNTERDFYGKIIEQSINIEHIKALPPVELTKEDFQKFVKTEYGIDISFADCENRDTFEKLFKPKHGWIPVSERLPEGLMVKTLVSCENDNGLPISTMVALYDAFSKTWDCEYKVIAWMPLPEPYKERGDKE